MLITCLEMLSTEYRQGHGERAMIFMLSYLCSLCVSSSNSLKHFCSSTSCLFSHCSLSTQGLFKCSLMIALHSPILSSLFCSSISMFTRTATIIKMLTIPTMIWFLRNLFNFYSMLGTFSLYQFGYNFFLHLND